MRAGLRPGVSVRRERLPLLQVEGRDPLPRGRAPRRGGEVSTHDYHDWTVFIVAGFETIIFGWSRCHRCGVQLTPERQYFECPAPRDLVTTRSASVQRTR